MGHRLDRLFRPASVAVVGASPKGGYGLRTLRNTRHLGYGGRLYAVHPTHREVDGVPAYPSLADLPEVPDAVAAAVPAHAVPGVVAEAAELGAGGMVVYAAGFAERDREGRDRQDGIIAACADRLPLIGPNCLGLASFRGRAALWGIEMPYVHAGAEGTVALAAQSGNMSLTTMLSGRLPAVAYGVSVGNQAVLDLADCLGYFLSDPGVRVVGLVMEGLTDLPRFRRLAERAAERDVAVVALKVGRSARGEAATVAHTGTLAGSDGVYDALFRQTGVHRVDDLDEMVALCSLLAAPRRPRGGALAVYASSGGECGLVADLAEDAGAELAELDAATESALAAALPDYAQIANPLDLTASSWGNRDVYRAAARAMGTCPGVGVVAFVGDAPTHTDPLDAMGWPEMIGGSAEGAAGLDVPVTLVTTTTDIVPGLVTMAHEHGVVLLAGARPALRAIALASERRAVAPAPAPGASGVQADARALLAAAGPEPSESDAKRLLGLYGVPTPDGGAATDAETAVAIARRVGHPVVCKVQAPGLAHKSDVGGVELGLTGDDAVRAAFHRLILRGADALGPGAALAVRVERMAEPGVELIVGGSNGPAGPLVVLGAGGVLTELVADATGLLWPFGPGDVRAALTRLRVGRLLDGYRGAPPADIGALADAVVGVGRLLADLPEIAEIDVNPLLCRSEGCLALDALIVRATGKGPQT
ncbi:acetate--CoA ligase family protein [Spongiactinospora sp. TRM90649]|uniref:acetate--CoA ligase family protein n=1 Tax=Spongiactinospora sp. TRM90649 TaxID=3031114 RepID=UPI0023F8B2CE|nr:acetate--CoA ligase family protein [Spongiactinospora sp. TRM90649]MDF5751671.1 acetate--CoA ligase family protein [Spongiactinospora sp. TRM90649]